MVFHIYHVPLAALPASIIHVKHVIHWYMFYINIQSFSLYCLFIFLYIRVTSETEEEVWWLPNRFKLSPVMLYYSCGTSVVVFVKMVISLSK